MRIPRLVAALLLTLSALPIVGCGGSSLVGSKLPLQRVVVYRNGIAYFERGGKVSESQVVFKMQGQTVNDFLATLAVMERGGSSVRAAAFPLTDDSSPVQCDPDPAATARNAETVQANPLRACTKDELHDMRKVVLSLDGEDHDLQVGYVAASPVWRPSYRLVMGDKEGALQAWGIVQNMSGEDWKDVHLSLVAGAPLAFNAELSRATIPVRPTITDNGEVIGSVPTAETSLAQRSMAALPVAPAVAASPTDEAQRADLSDDAISAEAAGLRGAAALGSGAIARSRKSGATKGSAKVAAPRAGATGNMFGDTVHTPPMPPSMAPSAPRSMSSLAAVTSDQASTRYDLPNTVSIPDRSATMVMLTSKNVGGEIAYLFAPDGGVPDSASHPFRVARFKNETGGALERGPIAVFDKGAFVGQGLIDPLPTGATTTVPFALDRSVGVRQSRSYDQRDERVAKIENGQLVLRHDATSLTTYNLENGGDKRAKLILKHSRQAGARLHNAPTDTEDNVAAASALVPVWLEPNAKRDFVVEERSTQERGANWNETSAEAAIKKLLESNELDATTKQKLESAWSVRATSKALQDKANQLSVDEQGLQRQAQETRSNLQSIEKNPVAGKLRAELTKRLSETSAKLDRVQKDLVETRAKLTENDIRFRDALRDVKFYAKEGSNK